MTRWRVWKWVLVTGALHVFGALLFGGLATLGTPSSINVVWITGICVIGALTILVAVIVFIYAGVQKSKFEQTQAMQGASSPSEATGEQTEESGETVQALLRTKRTIASSFLTR